MVYFDYGKWQFFIIPNGKFRLDQVAIYEHESLIKKHLRLKFVTKSKCNQQLQLKNPLVTQVKSH
jgi:hypothetical protein